MGENEKSDSLMDRFKANFQLPRLDLDGGTLPPG
jgi:hypothetical protein